MPISAVVFGAIALCAFIFDAAAVRLWFMRHRLGAVAIGGISAAALVVTFTNSLGAIAGRADATQAERARATNEVAADRAELTRLVRERAAIALRPVTPDAVIAGREAVAAAERIRLAECGNGDARQRGSNCRCAGDRGAEPSAMFWPPCSGTRRHRPRQPSSMPPWQHPRPTRPMPRPCRTPTRWEPALEALLGTGASVLTAWQQAIVAAVFELCLVGVMVIYELLGHAKQPHPCIEIVQDQTTTRHHVELAKVPPSQEIKPLPSPARSKAVNKAKGSVKIFVRNHVFPADGEKVEIKVLMRDYRAWCTRASVTPLDASPFLDELEKLCRKLGIQINVGDDQRVYCLNVAVTTAPEGEAEAVRLRPAYHS